MFHVEQGIKLVGANNICESGSAKAAPANTTKGLKVTGKKYVGVTLDQYSRAVKVAAGGGSLSPGRNP
jgi:hypothetical protein